MNLKTKNDIRKQITQLVNENQIYLSQLSDDICKIIINSSQFKNSNIILGYMALPDEVEIFPVIQNALANNKEVFLPHINSSNNSISDMCFYSYTQATKTTIGKYNIIEPQFSPKKTKIFLPNQVELDNTKVLILIPGRAFTKQGDRLGRGKGYYDLFLSSINFNKNLIKAGVCFPFQIIQNLPVDLHDIKMDLIY